MSRSNWPVVFVLACALVGCTKDEPNDDGDDDEGGTVTETIGSDGGTVGGPSGAELEIPAGALDADTEISIERPESGYPSLPETVEASGEVFAFLPHGQAFSEPVTITVP